MASLIFRLRNVPDEEADAIRSLLDDNNIEWYETTAGNWGIAMPGIWCSDDNDSSRAMDLIGRYQQQFTQQQREHFAQQEATGQHTTLWQRIKDHPVRTAGIAIFCLFIVYVSTHPFIQLAGYGKS